MRLASHNTFTYLTPRKWWGRLLAFTARCQRVDYNDQLQLGAQMFDLRVRFDKNGKPVVCHGLIEYDDPCFDVGFGLLAINSAAQREGIIYYCRVVLESKNPDEFQKECFRKYCEFLPSSLPYIRFFGGNDRSDWGCKNPVYDFGVPLPDIDEKHASTTALFPRFPRLDDLCPILYARLFNHRDIEQGTTHDWLMIDFVDVQ